MSFRREGSSKFGINHKWGSFPAISAWLENDTGRLYAKYRLAE
jgi:hypothetical protein